MQCFYDFHIHSCLSPCGDMDMTPNNIVNMALLKGLDAIAVTDHNCAANAEAILRVAEGKLVVLPGMEVESCEEVHMVCLFAGLDACLQMEAHVRAQMLGIKNKIEVYGEQAIVNEQDERVGQIDDLLVTATKLSVYDIVNLTHSCGGACIAAHVDKSSYSILSNLGLMPEDLLVDGVEISRNGDYETLINMHSGLSRYRAFYSSDAHYLADISEREHGLEVPQIRAESIIKVLRSGIK